MSKVYILGGARTPQGSFLGSLANVPAPRLGAFAIQSALDKVGLKKEEVNEVFMGNVVAAGVGQAPARQAALFAELPQSVPCTTVNKVCGSGMQTVILGARTIALEENDLVVAGGMENMSLAPHLLMGSRQGHKFGATEMKDSMQWDGLWDVYSDRPMGNCAEVCASEYAFSREEQDNYARKSFERAQKAQADGVFKSEIGAVTLQTRKGEVVVSEDEGPSKVNFDKMSKLRPAFEKDGTITAANASTINDGACALVLAGEKYKDQAKFYISSYASHAQDPTWFTTAPVKAVEKALKKVNLSVNDIDLWEINEAFALVSMAAIKDLGLADDKVNIYGGAVSLGHPIGTSGNRIILTLMNAMERKNAKRGVAAICIGGGEALALVIERL